MSTRPDDTTTFDWKNPDYGAVLAAREARLQRLRADPELFSQACAFYRDNPASFVHDWSCTADPRVVSQGRPAVMPFLLMPRQRELLDDIMAAWRASEPLIIEKSRDCGASWLMMALACTLCLFHRNLTIGFGSRKEELVDHSGDPSSLFHKGRMFLQYLPAEFKQGWNVKQHSAHMRLIFPMTEGAIVGEAGDNIGRGGRSSIFFVDEAAHIERPLLVDAALLANTDCRVDASSVNGMANSFAERRHSGRIRVFTYHYRDDLRKGPDWARKKQAEVDPIVWASEYELNYLASVSNIIIDAQWIQASVDAHIKLGIQPSGVKRGALDVADEGRDLNAFAARHGVVVTQCVSWSGKGGDLFETTERAYMLADELELEGFSFDSDGLGAGCRAAANRITERRKENQQRFIRVEPFRGSAAVVNPEKKAPGTDVKNADRYQNLKAQSCFTLRDRFYNTYRAVNGAKDVDLDNIISLSSGIRELNKLCVELSMPQWKPSGTGKVMVEKAPDGAASPNLFDAVMQLMGAPYKPVVRVKDSHIEGLGGAGDWRSQYRPQIR